MFPDSLLFGSMRDLIQCQALDEMSGLVSQSGQARKTSYFGGNVFHESMEGRDNEA